MNNGFEPGLIQTISVWLGSGSINLFGRPFAGKDTQSRRLAKLLKATLIGGGDILRSNSNFASTQAKVENGNLAPTQEYLKIVEPYLAKAALKNKPLILNSVGRWHGEEPSILKAAATAGHPTKAVVYINIGEVEFRQRWQIASQSGDRGKRADDAKSALARRQSEFQAKTLPVIGFYRDLGLLIEVNGEQTIDDVTTEILTQLFYKAQAAQ